MDLQNIKGIGEKTILSLYDSKIYNIDDLINFFPYRYEILKPDILTNTNDGEKVCVNALVSSEVKVSFIKKNLNSLRFKALVNGNLVWVTIFNRAFLKQHLKIGKEIIIMGKYLAKNRSFVASNIKLGKLENKEIIPVYHNVKDIKSSKISSFIDEALANYEALEYIPLEYQKKYQFIKKNEALRNIHFPKSEELLNEAKRMLIYEELFVFLFRVHYLKSLKDSELGISKNVDYQKLVDFLKSLPFSLTSDQKKVIKEGLEDFQSKKRMNRLVLGDVGSGKTIVATALMYLNTLAGYQSAFLAPTEILATQHFYSIYKLLKNYGVNIELLIGSMSKKEKKSVIKRVNDGEIDILIGTHAMLNEELTFNKLGLVITDEQHRFGVKQRKDLQEKGIKPDVLFMSATPIPRTYALTIYGDMDVSFIKEKPQGRKEIITQVKKESDLRSVLLKVLEEIKNNHQIYVVAPRQLESDNSELKTVNLLKEKFNIAFNGKVPIDVLHGKLKGNIKEDIMNNFKNGITKILIATTVIEVGVNVPNATTMIIFDADRYGLATLHQLRGRVGRSDVQSYCFLICNKELERLKVLEESNDGFYISEKDFEFRGEGDIFGQRQSGDMTFKIADLRKNYDVFLQVKEDVLHWLDTKEYLKMPSYQKIIEELEFNN